MKPFHLIQFAAILISLAALPACRKRSESPIVDSQRVLPELMQRNNVGPLPGSVHQQAADSPIHWQPWTRESLQYAQASERMIFAMVAMPQAPGFVESLDALAADPHLVETINSTYLPVLIDGDAAREIGILTADLASEIKQNVSLPFMIWMSPEANPVAWIPAPWVDGESLREQFRNSHTLVAKIWEESPGYVMKNSAMDNQARRARIERRRLSNIESENPEVDTVRAVRQLCSLYDPLSRNFDEVGGLFPSGAIDLLAAAAMQPDLPPGDRDRAMTTLDHLLKDLLGSAMFDPLDGGLFSSRRANSWSLPVFHRHSIAQSRAALSLFRAHQATGNELALERALGMLKFNEANYQTPDGLFAIGLTPSSDPQLWLWSLAETEQILGSDDANWWAGLTGMKALGNIPYEIDPDRRFFRRNSIAIGHTLDELAADGGLDRGAFEEKLRSIRAKLLAAREARIGKIPPDKSPNAGASFRMVSTYAAAYTATGDPTWRDKAVALLTRSRQAFSEGARLRVFSTEGAPSVTQARAFIYALAIQSVLDVIDITGDSMWFDWCDDLATVMTEMFTDEDFLREASDEAAILDLPVTDVIMLFDDSSVGLLNFAECRLAAHGRPLARDLVAMAGTLPSSSVAFPVQHTDLLQSFLSRNHAVTIVYDSSTSSELLTAVRRLPLRMFHRRTATSSEELPEGGVLVIRRDGRTSPATNSAELTNALLPDGVNF